MNIITYLATDLADKAKYDQLSYHSNNEKRLIYWRCTYIFFITAKKCNPDASLLLYTNDSDAIIDDGINLLDKINALGVRIEYLPFVEFKPPSHLSTRFTNAFYKYTVIEAVANTLEDSSIILDNDCVWISNYKKYASELFMDIPTVYNPYDLSSDPDEKNANGVSSNELGAFFKKIDHAYPVKSPVWYGGEFVSATAQGMKMLANELRNSFEYISANASSDLKLQLNGGLSKKVFDGNEFTWGYTLNKIKHRCIDPDLFVKRIWTGVNGEIEQPAEYLNLTVWHLISEKTLGLHELYKSIIDKEDFFWELQMEEIPGYLGGYFGIPKRIVKVSRPNKIYVFTRKVISKLKHMYFERKVVKAELN